MVVFDNDVVSLIRFVEILLSISVGGCDS